jgi:hypothetical protein
MGNQYFDRYQDFKVDGGYKPLPFIKIEPKNSDKTVHGWLILLANPIYGGVEENIPDKEIIRIPFPLTDSIQQYIKAVEKYKLLNGID